MFFFHRIQLAMQIGAQFCEVSALETTNVFEAFQFFSRDVFLEYVSFLSCCTITEDRLLR